MLHLDKLGWQICQPVAIALLVGWSVSAVWASDVETFKPCTRQSTWQARREREDSHWTRPSGATPDNKHRRGTAATVGFCPAHSTQDFFSDQKAIWTSPFHLHTDDKNWLVPLGVGTLGLVAGDQDIMRHFGDTPMAHSSSFSNYGLAAMVGSAATFYLRGAITHDDHSRETGFLAGEAAVNGLVLGETMKLVFQRPRPNAANAGSFGAGGASFPSEHALSAWSIATVIAHEYPGPLTKLLAYGAATGISLSRVAARQHFPSDVVVGSALGYLIGRYVYLAHHDLELPGASRNPFGNNFKENAPPRARTPAELGSPSVPLDSWGYAAFDRLAALGYAPSAFANLRPWTRMECARIIAAAGDDLRIDDLDIDNLRINDVRINDVHIADLRRDHLGPDDNHPSEADRLYAALKAEFATDLRRFDGSGTSEVRVDSIYTRYTGIAGTPLDDGYHFGQTLTNDYGRLYGQGSNLVSGASASGSGGPVAFYVRGEYQHAGRYPPTVNRFSR